LVKKPRLLFQALVQLAVYSGNAVTTRAATTQYDAFGVTWRSLRGRISLTVIHRRPTVILAPPVLGHLRYKQSRCGTRRSFIHSTQCVYCAII